MSRFYLKNWLRGLIIDEEFDFRCNRLHSKDITFTSSNSKFSDDETVIFTLMNQDLIYKEIQ